LRYIHSGAPYVALYRDRPKRTFLLQLLKPDIGVDDVFTPEVVTKVHACIFDEFMRVLLRQLNRLNLSSTIPFMFALLIARDAVSANEAAPPAAADATVAADAPADATPTLHQLPSLVPSVASDVIIFAHMIDFCTLMLRKVHPELFPRWACMLFPRSLARYLTPCQTSSARLLFRMLHVTPHSADPTSCSPLPLK
jgi:hypothetical protein